MGEAFELAEHGRYSTPPNPAVGCVIVANDQVVGRGFHARAGLPHAEIEALAVAGAASRGATAYVTLEPCNHHGRTGPCTEALLKAGISRVLYAMDDPNPRVAGTGAERLRAAGVNIERLQQDSRTAGLNRGYCHRQQTGRPFVSIKIAMSLDGAMALESGESQWITGPAARARVQRMRAACGAVITGVGTVLSDDPSLNVRDASLETRGRQPLRVVLDSNLRTPPSAALLGLPGETHILSTTTSGSRGALLQERGAVVSCLPAEGRRPGLAAVLAHMAALEVNEVLLEAGPTLAGAMIAAGHFDELAVFVAPKLLGVQARRAFDLSSPAVLADAFHLELRSHEQVGDDMLLIFTPDGKT